MKILLIVLQEYDLGIIIFLVVSKMIFIIIQENDTHSYIRK